MTSNNSDDVETGIAASADDYRYAAGKFVLSEVSSMIARHRAEAEQIGKMRHALHTVYADEENATTWSFMRNARLAEKVSKRYDKVCKQLRVRHAIIDGIRNASKFGLSSAAIVVVLYIITSSLLVLFVGMFICAVIAMAAGAAPAMSRHPLITIEESMKWGLDAENHVYVPYAEKRVRSWDAFEERLARANV
jgi:hypothetical protein